MYVLTGGQQLGPTSEKKLHRAGKTEYSTQPTFYQKKEKGKENKKTMREDFEMVSSSV